MEAKPKLLCSNPSCSLPSQRPQATSSVSPMRILHVIYDDVGNSWLGGGGATRTLEIYSRIARLGHRVTVVCGNYPGAARTESRQGITYRRMGLSRSYAVSRLSFMLGAARLVSAGGYDIVV